MTFPCIYSPDSNLSSSEVFYLLYDRHCTEGRVCPSLLPMISSNLMEYIAHFSGPDHLVWILKTVISLYLCEPVQLFVFSHFFPCSLSVHLPPSTYPPPSPSVCLSVCFTVFRPPSSSLFLSLSPFLSFTFNTASRNMEHLATETGNTASRSYTPPAREGDK